MIHMWWWLFTLTLAHGMHLHAGRDHNMSNFHIIAQLPGGLNATGIMFIDCSPSCASGSVLLNVTDLTAADSIRASRVLQDVYDIQWTVPEDKQRHHINMILVPPGCVERACRISEESYPECGPGSILTSGTCHACAAGAYQHETQCTVCAAGRYSARGASECAYCPAGQFSTAGASSCASLTPPVATVQQTITFVGIPKASLKTQRDGLRILIADLYDVPVTHVDIISIGGDLLTGRRLSDSVPVEYRVLVYEAEDVQTVETRAVNLQPESLVQKLVDRFLPAFDSTGVTAALGTPVTRLLASVQEHSWDIAVPIGAGVLVLAVVLWAVCHTPTATPPYYIPLIQGKDTQIYF